MKKLPVSYPARTVAALAGVFCPFIKKLEVLV